MNKIANKNVINDVLIEEAAKDKNIVVLCSDSRGSAGLNPYVKAHPAQFVEVGIAEQNLVSIAAGLAVCGKKSFVFSPASFLSTRSMEQAKVDVAYSHTNVKLIGISGGVSYGELGMTHQSANDIAIMASTPGLRVYLPCDRFQTEKLIRALLQDKDPAYVRIGRNPVADVYEEGNVPFELNKAVTIQDGSDVTIIACGEMVQGAKASGELLKAKGISARVIDMYCVKPIDREAIIKAAKETKLILTVEEHVKLGGLGSMVAQVAAENAPVKVVSLGLPDEPAIAGKSAQIFHYYGMDAEGIVKKISELL
ncbi:MAG: transketolase family protein [Selenomonadaceae bacterium]|nr:transketolase family protein [Selenomonadaceae bacterium]